MSSLSVEQQLTELWETPKSVYGWFASVDHKDLGIRYIVTAFVFLIIGGLEALVMRLQLTHANATVLSPEVYDRLFSMHGITMIFWYASPVLTGFSVYLVPLMIGARDIAFPRLNSFTYWSFVFSGILLYVGPFIGQVPHAGWFSYMPYTNIVYSPTHGMDSTRSRSSSWESLPLPPRSISSSRFCASVPPEWRSARCRCFFTARLPSR